MNFFDFIYDKKIIIMIISIALNVLLISGSVYLVYTNLGNETNYIPNDNLIATETKEFVEDKIYVELKGEVKNPGVYEVTNNNIINDVVKLSGGFTKSAYTNNINLSKKVSDELVIYVFSKSEFKKLNAKPEIVECVCDKYEINDCIDKGASEIINSEAITNEDSTSNIIVENENKNTVEIKTEEENKSSEIESDNNINLININNATKEELMTLSGIGESKANAIIEYRTKTKFEKIEDIKNVSGIGDSAFEKIKNSITV